MIINFSIYSHVLHRNMVKPNISNLVRRLMSIITLNCDVVNSKGNPYDFDASECYKFFNGEKEIYENIKKGANSKCRVTDCSDTMYDLYEEFFDEISKQNLCKSMYELVEQDECIPPVLKEEFFVLYEDEQYVDFLTKVFLYAVCNPNVYNSKRNQEKKEINIKDEINNISEKLKMYKKGVILSVPDKIQPHEETYIVELLKACAEDANIESITIEEILSKDEFEQYRIKLQRSRRDFFAAESIRESLKDSNFSDKNYFEEVKLETYDSVIDVVEEEHKNGYIRFVEVMKHIITVPLKSFVACIPDWIKASEKKGICHILVNDKLISWTVKKHV